MQENCSQTQDSYYEQSQPSEVKLQNITLHFVKNFRVTTETRLQASARAEKKKTWVFCSRALPRKDKEVLWRHPVRKRRFSSQKMPCLQHVQISNENRCTQVWQYGQYWQQSTGQLDSAFLKGETQGDSHVEQSPRDSAGIRIWVGIGNSTIHRDVTILPPSV